MGIGHPYFNRDVSTWPPQVNQQQQSLQQQALGLGQQAQLNPYNDVAMQRYYESCSGSGVSGGYESIGTLLPPTPKQPEKKSMFKEITADIKGFLLEHRGVIYFIACALILDHFLFRGAFKARLQVMAEKVVTKVEEQIK